jgi:hypothetical protein
MNHDQRIEAHIQKNALAILELDIRIEALNRDIEMLLNELKVAPQQLTTFIENQANFSEKDWQTLTDQRKALDEKLLRELLNISNPKQTQKAFKQRNVQPHWLFVR